MNSKRKKIIDQSKPGIQMKELEAETGVPKSTILHYHSLGLLPEPVKTNHNMSYYDPQCIDRIQFIRDLQRHHRLSLKEIKEVIDKAGRNTNLKTRLELTRHVIGKSTQGRHFRHDDFSRRTGLSKKQINKLCKLKLLLPLEDGQFDEEDILLGKAFAQAISWGIKISDLSFYAKLADQIIDNELSLRHRITSDMSYEKDAEITLKMIKSAQLFRSYIINRLFLTRVKQLRDIKE